MASETSQWSHVPLAPPDAILGVTAAFKACTNPNKLNLGVGAYRDEAGQPYVLDVVKKVETDMLAANENKEYVPIEGLPEFLRLTSRLLLGADHPAIVEERTATVQSLSGTGALRIAGEWIATITPKATVYISDPSWGNHVSVFQRSGLATAKYRYFCKETKGVDFSGMIEDLRAAPEGSVLLLHTCAHNPTGSDLTPAQWEDVLALTIEKKFLPIFDTAYQGFATGDLDNDAAAARHFAAKGLELMVTQSYAKNMGLYGERIGALIVVTKSKAVATNVLSQLKTVIRPMYSSPPVHGARIVARILADEALAAQWRAELKHMSDRIGRMRVELLAALVANGAPGNWEHVTRHIGMFTFTGLNPAQVEFLTEKKAIFLTKDGRISMAGLNSASVPYLADAIKEAVSTIA